MRSFIDGILLGIGIGIALALCYISAQVWIRILFKPTVNLMIIPL